MNNITVSLEKAKNLKEAGWMEPTEFVGHIEEVNIDGDCDFIITHRGAKGVWRNKGESELWFPTAEEILRELPQIISDKYMTIFKDGDSWLVEYNTIPQSPDSFYKDADTLANAAASMYCYLSDNNLLNE